MLTSGDVIEELLQLISSLTDDIKQRKSVLQFLRGCLQVLYGVCIRIAIDEFSKQPGSGFIANTQMKDGA